MFVENSIENLKRRIGVEWQNPSLLLEALTHSSYAYEHKGKFTTKDNERLEFLGDAVLELIISEYLYVVCQDKMEGELTKIRARVVCEPSLAMVSKEINLGQCLYMGKGEERSGGRKRPSILADAFEALLGAIYLDQGYYVTKNYILKELTRIINSVLNGNLERDYKTELQEYLQQRNGNAARYHLVKEEGPDHNKVFTVAVSHQDKILGTGKGRSKKEAEQQAASMALEYQDNSK
ncbi:MAG: ribonuclease III [Clostridiales bacterium]|nr:ribonuclease III [Clostridiales bacterium]MCF8022596.1 ribonuclease III [Clostridiales bacterium]